MKKILCIGHCVLDMIFTCDHLLKEEGKYPAQAYRQVGGGPAATASVAVARLGGESFFAGRVGDDIEGKTLLQELSGYGVNHEYTIVLPEVSTSLSAVIVDEKGYRQIVNYKDKQLDSAMEKLTRVPWETFDCILVDVRWHEGAFYALRQAKKYSIPSVLDGDVTDTPIHDLVSLATYTLFSNPGLLACAEESDAREALVSMRRQYGGYMGVTLGEEGVLYYDENKCLQHLSAFSVQAIDTTGAGDVFHGAFALFIAQGNDMKTAVAQASAVAALKCTKAGGRAGIPSMEKVEAFLQSYSG